MGYRGEYGIGMMANELSLGCDCVGQIHYLVRLLRFYYVAGQALMAYTNSLDLSQHTMGALS